MNEIADKCENCDKLTLGLSGSTKWCAYCGAKLTGDIGSAPIEVHLPERCTEVTLGEYKFQTNYATGWNDCLDAIENNNKGTK